MYWIVDREGLLMACATSRETAERICDRYHRAAEVRDGDVTVSVKRDGVVVRVGAEVPCVVGLVA